MKNQLKFSTILVLSVLLFCNSCKDDTVADPTDQFVGTYSYVMFFKGGLTGRQAGDFTIRKIAANKIVTTLTNGSETYNTVTGNELLEDENQISNLPISDTETAEFDENSYGKLEGNTLTIKGLWKRVGYMTSSFTITATKK